MGKATVFMGFPTFEIYSTAPFVSTAKAIIECEKSVKECISVALMGC